MLVNYSTQRNILFLVSQQDCIPFWVHRRTRFLNRRSLKGQCVNFVNCDPNIYPRPINGHGMRSSDKTLVSISPEKARRTDRGQNPGRRIIMHIGKS